MVLMVAACSRKDQPLTTTVTPAQETAFGKAVMQSILGHTFLSSNRRATIQVVSVNDKLNTAAGTKYIAALVMARPVQAAVPVPLDQIVITEDLAAAAKTDSELAAVLAHQMGHLAAHQPMEKLKNAHLSKGRTGLMMLAGWNAESNDGESQLVLNELAARLWEMQYTADEERQAEAYASGLLPKAGYPPAAMQTLVDRLTARGAKEGRAPEYLTMHPAK